MHYHLQTGHLINHNMSFKATLKWQWLHRHEMRKTIMSLVWLFSFQQMLWLSELGCIHFTNVLGRWKALCALLHLWWKTITLVGELMAHSLNKEYETLLKYHKVINNAFGGLKWVALVIIKKEWSCPSVLGENLYFRTVQHPPSW